MKTTALFSLLFVFCLIFNYPNLFASDEEPQRESLSAHPYMVGEGSLPGVTWVDDIHPIFVRNRCRFCHIRGNVLYVTDLNKFALGLIDPTDSSNAFYSYHELVYAEGPPQIQKDEPLRDGQCCWPAGYPANKQRRIWVGHAERSALMRKLERDYFDWDSPPRFVEEGLRLTWGLPMPWVRPEETPSGINEPIKVRNYLSQSVIYLRLWLGMGKPEITELPPKIAVRDRALIRYWINNSIMTDSDDSGIEIRAIDSHGKPVPNTRIFFVGNFNNIKRREVYDRFALKTGGDGIARLTFPRWSVVTSFWYVQAEEGEYVPITVENGKMVKKDVEVQNE